MDIIQLGPGRVAGVESICVCVCVYFCVLDVCTYADTCCICMISGASSFISPFSVLGEFPARFARIGLRHCKKICDRELPFGNKCVCTSVLNNSCMSS